MRRLCSPSEKGGLRPVFPAPQLLGARSRCGHNRKSCRDSDVSSRMGSSVPPRSCPPRTPRGAWPASSRWHWRWVAGQVGEALCDLVGRHRCVVDLAADRPQAQSRSWHGRVDEGGFAMRMARRVAVRAVRGAEHHSFTGVRTGAPLAFRNTTTNLAGSVVLALRPTT